MRTFHLFLIGINLLCLILYGLDKYYAVTNKRRIPEKVLLSGALLGGALGSFLGMHLFHHKTKKRKFWLVPFFFLLWIIFYGYCYYQENKVYYTAQDFGIKVIKSKKDFNQNGVDDATDILLGARTDAQNHPTYKSEYYEGGYPPDHLGVCTDTVWRAFQQAGYSLRDLVDLDIRDNLSLYPRVVGKADKNIDFRRVKNLKVYFDRHAKVLTNDLTKIEEWMPGDIVIFGDQYRHIGIISDKRNRKGIPWMIHNAGQMNREENTLSHWEEDYTITGHYRWRE